MTTTSPAREAPEGAAADGGRDGGARGAVDGVVRRVRDVWARTPLLARLVGITTVLLAMGLGIAGTATTTLLSRFLVEQFDERLVAANETYKEHVGEVYGATGSLDALKGTYAWGAFDYALRAEIDGDAVEMTPGPSTTSKYGEPRLPDLDTATLTRARTVTMTSDVRGSAWRGIVTPIVSKGSTGERTVIGYLLYAEPLGDVQGTVRQAAILLWTSAAAIVVIGAVVGTWAVRRSLRGLREIEGTAAQIAAGDLSQRVPAAPETTEVGRLGAALNSMLAQIETAFDARTRSEERMRRFVADASHELRTPLAAIRGYGELYRMGALTEKDQVDDTMRRIEQSATRMGGLVEDLLALARLDADRPGRAEPVDLAVLATDAAHDLRAIDPTREVRVGPLADAPAGAPGAVGDLPATVVRGDEARLRQVVANLVGNVARHTPAGTPAEIGVGRVGDRVVIEVRDHGPGIAPEHAARVFERFYRVDPSRTREGDGTGGGAGLGMAIVAAIVAAHHGDVAISQTPGGGATVRVALPSGAPADTPEGDGACPDDARDHPTG
ncbi:sensor histidine kinase [Cellulomonas pakistanensis]|uniref:histidine kinase n=1 Tax=Cellulomonas pakistanensis TaxID=992287 RepID=A0A919PAN2_9CELL|nr:HAMP domain-containing sensor histidine kinase [Cellulomonas pakistanensis]GIG35464.1 two-component sensor histidine kinase [Cellulomonas pakistanensis]